MENSNYNSLTKKLIESGILSSDNNIETEDKSNNIFTNANTEENMPELYCENPIIEQPKENNNKKRINKFDLDIIKDNSADDIIKSNINFGTFAVFKILHKFLNLNKIFLSDNSLTSFEKLILKFFPKIYKIKIAKEAMLKFNKLNTDAKLLLDKTIPYGENDIRYQDLVKYLSVANEIQLKLKKKI